jgi:Putative auto-transporter adhesin, head GIN domain
MIKLILFVTKVIAATIIALLFNSCQNGGVLFNNGIDGNGNVQTETRTITETFTKVVVSRGIDVVLEQADIVKIEVEADENLLQHITTKVENGVLKISSDENIDNAEAMKVRVSMPTITVIETTSGATVTGKNTLKGTNLKVKTSSGSEIQATLEFDEISCESTSGSNIDVAGKALKLETASSSGSEINAESLLANEIFAQSTSGSSTQVHPLVKLSGKASSGSSIDYDGNPKTVEKEETSGGSVSSN